MVMAGGSACAAHKILFAVVNGEPARHRRQAARRRNGTTTLTQAAHPALTTSLAVHNYAIGAAFIELAAALTTNRVGRAQSTGPVVIDGADREAARTTQSCCGCYRERAGCQRCCDGAALPRTRSWVAPT